MSVATFSEREGLENRLGGITPLKKTCFLFSFFIFLQLLFVFGQRQWRAAPPGIAGTLLCKKYACMFKCTISVNIITDTTCFVVRFFFVRSFLICRLQNMEHAPVITFTAYI